jgi:cell division protein FtsQ
MMSNEKKRSIVLPVVFMTSLLFILMFSGWHLAESGFKDIVPIENVEIEGFYENISLNDLRDKVVSVLEGGYFTVDLEVVRNALLDLPWVEDASVRRQWPAGLHIKVIEKQAVAYWGENTMLSNRGELFTPLMIVKNKPLPKLHGPEGLHKKVWDFLMEANNGFNEIGLEINRLALDERRAWTLVIANRGITQEVVVRLGREDTANRLDRFVRVFADDTILDLNDIAVIDMRYPNGFAMRKKNKDVKLSAFKQAGIVLEG